MKPQSHESAEAILFFENGKVSREMLFHEFEAILDRYVPAIELADQSCSAVYVRINHKLSVTAAVFFTITFDGSGFPDSRWNVPLQHLAEVSAKGPDLGAGPIKLSCYSQCAIAWQQKNLWNPDLTPGKNSFVAIKKTIERNKLGILYDDPANIKPIGTPQAASSSVTIDLEKLEKQLTQQLRRRYQQEFRDHVAQLIKEQRLRLATVNADHEQALENLKLEHLQREEKSKSEIDLLKKRIREQAETNKQLKETVAVNAQKVSSVREYFEHKLSSAQSGSKEQLRILQENYQLEIETKLTAATQDLQEKLQMLEIELMYRNEQESSLNDEIRRLREDNQSLLNNSGDQLLQKLSRSGINFVAYHTGVGHITVPAQEMSSYLEAPIEYAARKAGVSSQHYQRWLEHYQNPICRALKQNGDACCSSIDRIAVPSDFHAGESDRCSHHRHAPMLAVASV